MKEKKILTRTAILAMEVGFNSFNNEGWFYQSSRGHEIWTNNKGGIDGTLKTYVKCAQSILQKWLRERHKIYVVPMDWGDGVNYWPKLVDLENDPKNSFTERLSYIYYKENEKAKFNSYEKALEVGLYDALKIIQKRKLK
jgi:hypothetical protein